jgi:hypothetical protein
MNTPNTPENSHDLATSEVPGTELDKRALNEVVGGAPTLLSLPDFTRLQLRPVPTPSTPLLDGFTLPRISPILRHDPLGPISDSVAVGAFCVTWTKDY